MKFFKLHPYKLGKSTLKIKTQETRKLTKDIRRFLNGGRTRTENVSAYIFNESNSKYFLK